ncbi:3-keto-disaccharide hydrolase [Tautonia plasticadhaerens]|uniref:3-keto-alpha-glucoside-1,2-lyase/3-keto-2-hydroxy-glucal hydratase domain-containing protein n=1 Tax=Tautonia plasticadhaerens TaxID=2527974 RepID=A0A518H575_9BACT|nr:DUF1080 domain-containing protein [Tautonia plasticadhaerens]QDV35995.1 hypothetical protein ElP_39050 [Tautonia plasticadhaerens]
MSCTAAFATLIAIVLAPGDDAPRPTDEPGFAPLFDGESIDGWERFGGQNPDAWKVEDSCLVMDGKGGGWVGTDRDFGDFELRLRFRIAEPGSNSGVYLRAPADTSHISRTGMEIQILDDGHPRYADIQPWQRCGSIYHVAPADPGHLEPPGAWNDLEIRAVGPRVVIVLNGRTVVDDRIDRHPELESEHTGLGREAGRIGLQCHDGRVEFRELRIRELGEG